MDQNPYESPRTKGSPGRGGVRFTMIVVALMLIVLILVCGVLSVVAYFIARL